MPSVANRKSNTAKHDLIKTDSIQDKINLSEALKMRFENRFTYKEIADHFGVRKQDVHYKIKMFFNRLNASGGSLGLSDTLQAYSLNKQKLMSVAEYQLLVSTLDPAAIEKASLNNRAFAFGTIHKANLLEQGKPTEVIDSRQAILAGLTNLDKLNQELADREANSD
jgi:predicted DNA-binding protein YlxM (UPF0122 family)